MEIFWRQGGLSVREVHAALPLPRPAYTTVQTLIGRLESKGALKRTRKIGNAYIFEAGVSREAGQNRVLDDILSLFGGRPSLLMSRLVESGKLTLDDVQDAKKRLQELSRKGRSK
jgi:BlaI family penicillinase repressor